MPEIRMHLNELPWPPSSSVIKAAKAALDKMNRYSDENSHNDLKRYLSEYSYTGKSRIILSPGSDILLRDAAHLWGYGRKVITLCPSFLPTVSSARQTASELINIRLPLPDFNLNIDMLNAEIEGPCLIILDNPNNPTGQLVISPDQLTMLLKKKNVLVIMDEAYYEFSGTTCAQLIDEFPNLLVTRTLDKVMSMAGMRMGYGIAGDNFLKGFGDFPVYLPRATLAACLAALDDTEKAKKRVRKLINERDEMVNELNSNDIRVWNTHTNFIVINSKVAEVVTRLRDKGILVKDLSDQMPGGFIRVTIGKPKENRYFMKKFLELEKGITG